MADIILQTIKRKFGKTIKSESKEFHIKIVKIYGKDIGLIRAFVTFFNRVYIFIFHKIF